ncbi:HNH endonuclease [Anaerovoracaceae bacterium SGI.195]
MAKSFSKRFYNSRAWKKAREAYIAKVHGLCEDCGRPGYIVDHKEELTPRNINDPSIALSDDNFRYLCLECHNRKTFSKYSPVREGLKFDDEGNLIMVSPLKNFET